MRRRSLHSGIRGGVVFYLRVLVLIFELKNDLSDFFLPYVTIWFSAAFVVGGWWMGLRGWGFCYGLVELFGIWC